MQSATRRVLLQEKLSDKRRRWRGTGVRVTGPSVGAMSRRQYYHIIINSSGGLGWYRGNLC